MKFQLGSIRILFALNIVVPISLYASIPVKYTVLPGLKNYFDDSISIYGFIGLEILVQGLSTIVYILPN